MTTPFIDALSTDERQYVALHSKGDRRPSYFDASLAASQPGVENAGTIQISEDLEAVLLLLKAEVKRSLLDFILEAGKVASSFQDDDYALFSEVIEARDDGYRQIRRNVGSIAESYDQANQQMKDFVEAKARGSGGAAGASTSIAFPDLGAMFASLLEAYSTVTLPDELAMHSRITDAGFLYSVEGAAINRAKELSSWGNVVRTYLVT